MTGVGRLLLIVTLFQIPNAVTITDMYCISNISCIVLSYFHRQEWANYDLGGFCNGREMLCSHSLISINSDDIWGISNCGSGPRNGGCRCCWDDGLILVSLHYTLCKLNQLYRDSLNGLYMVTGIFFLLLFNCSALHCLGPAYKPFSSLCIVTKEGFRLL